MMLNEKVDRLRAAKMIEMGYVNSSELSEAEYEEIHAKAMKWFKEVYLGGK